jgi:hypothetical protein
VESGSIILRNKNLRIQKSFGQFVPPLWTNVGDTGFSRARLTYPHFFQSQFRGLSMPEISL